MDFNNLGRRHIREGILTTIRIAFMASANSVSTEATREGMIINSLNNLCQLISIHAIKLCLLVHTTIGTTSYDILNIYPNILHPAP